MLRSQRHGLAASFLSALALACSSEPRTEIVVEVTSNLAVPADLDRLDVSATGSVMSPSKTTMLGGGGRSFPITIGVTPATDTAANVTILVLGFRGGAEQVRREVRTRFLPRRRLHLVVDLTRGCVGIPPCAANTTCIDGGRCVDSFVDPAGLPAFSGRDAGHFDAPTDTALDSPGDVPTAETDVGDGPLDALPPDARVETGVLDFGVDVGAETGVPCTPANCGSTDCENAMCTGPTVCTRTRTSDCNDGNTCTTDVCTPSGCMRTVNMGARCDDRNSCTDSDVCSSTGTCAGTAITCDDSNPCTTNMCNPSSGCTYPPGPDGVMCSLMLPNDCYFASCMTGACQARFHPPGRSCNDGNACTAGDMCNGSGTCTGSSVSECDGDLCTTGDICSSISGCLRGSPISCNDGNPCTSDGCSPALGCTFTPIVDGGTICGNVCCPPGAFCCGTDICC